MFVFYSKFHTHLGTIIRYPQQEGDNCPYEYVVKAFRLEDDGEVRRHDIIMPVIIGCNVRTDIMFCGRYHSSIPSIWFRIE
jgi:hypothetical protein